MLGLHSNWENCSFSLFGHDWNYVVAVESKVYEGFFESGIQLLLQVYIQIQTEGAAFKPLLGAREKGIFFLTSQPGELFVI